MSKLDISFTRQNGNTISEDIWIFDTSPFQNYQSQSFGTFLLLLFEALEPDCRDEDKQTPHEYRDELITYFKNCMESNPDIVAPLENIKSFLMLCHKDKSLCNTHILNAFWSVLKYDVPRSRHLVDYMMLDLSDITSFRKHFNLGSVRFSLDKLRDTVDFICSEDSNKLYVCDISYCDSLVDMCYAYLYQLFSSGHTIKTCVNCGLHFISEHGEEYCSRISPQDSAKRCSDFAPAVNQQSKPIDNETTADSKSAESVNEQLLSDIDAITGEKSEANKESASEAAAFDNNPDNGKTAEKEQADSAKPFGGDAKAAIPQSKAGLSDDNAEEPKQLSNELPDAVQQSEQQVDNTNCADNAVKAAENKTAADESLSVMTVQTADEADPKEINDSAEKPSQDAEQKSKALQGGKESANGKGEDLSKLHRQIYMRKQMLVKRNPENQEYAKDFEQYKNDAKEWKKQVKAGKRNEQDYLQWLLQIK